MAKGWVELPTCGNPGATGQNQVPLAADLSNATWATCKVGPQNNDVPKVVGGTGNIFDPVVHHVDYDVPKNHEHQVTINA
jgi:hypothetical protein